MTDVDIRKILLLILTGWITSFVTFMATCYRQKGMHEASHLTDISKHLATEIGVIIDATYWCDAVMLALIVVPCICFLRFGKRAIALYTVPQVVLMGAAIYWAATVANYNYEELDNALNEALTEKFHNRNESEHRGLAYYETKFKCCGVNSSRDYINSQYTDWDLDLPIPYSCCLSTCKPHNWTEDYVCRDIKKDEVVNVTRCMSDYHSNVTSSECFHVQPCQQAIAEDFSRLIHDDVIFAVVIAETKMVFVLASFVCLLHGCKKWQKFKKWLKCG